MSGTRSIIVTSALPYANGDIHIGHLVEHIQTDIWVRFQKLRGHTCHYFCADDAHGTAIMLKAEDSNITPEAYIDGIQKDHIAAFNAFHISHDIYYTTHSKENQELSSFIYESADKKGVIKRKTIQQLFDPEKQLFLADRYIKGICPKCKAEDQYGDACEKCYATYSPTQLIQPYSTISGATPILKESDHYFFDLAKKQTQIEDWLDTQPVTQEVRNKCQEWLSEGLKDWDISRDAPYFGFLIPGTQDKYFYVWLDAPIGYIATAKKYAETQGGSLSDYWNDDHEIHHFIGKDIMYFHTLFWPAMLDCGDFSLPKKVHVHGFLTINGEKMSKSRGTFILAKDFAKIIDPTLLRYYLAAKLTPSMSDIDFSSEDFVNRVNADIINKFSNILSRTVAILAKNCNATLSKPDKPGEELLTQLLTHSDSVADYYEHLEMNKAVMIIMKQADVINTYINDTAPWHLVKTDPVMAQMVCTTAVNAFRVLCIWLKPIVPKLIETFEHTLNVPYLSWKDLGTFLYDHSLNDYHHHFKRLKQADIDPLFSS